MLNLASNAPQSLSSETLRMISTRSENLKLKLQANSLYLSAQLKDPNTQKDISPDNQSFLIDSGATKNFVDEQEAKRLKIPTEKLNQPIRVTLIDGNDSIAGVITHTSTIQLRFDDGTEQLEKFYLTKIDEEHPWVLGYDWLKRRNPEINWSEPSIVLDRNHEKARTIRLYETTTEAKTYKTFRNMSFKPEEQYQCIKTQRRNHRIPLLGHLKNKGNTFKSKILPTRRIKGYVKNMKASCFMNLVEKEELPITVLHIRTATTKGTSLIVAVMKLKERMIKLR